MVDSSLNESESFKSFDNNQLEFNSFKLQSIRSFNASNVNSCHPISNNFFDINSPSTYYPQNNLNYEIDDNILTIEAIGTTGVQNVSYFIDNVFDTLKSYTLSFKAKKLVAGSGNYARIQLTIQGSNDGSNFTSIRNITQNSPVVNQEYSLNYTVTGYTYYKLIFYNDASTPVQLGEKTQYYDVMFSEGTSIISYESYEGCIHGLELYDTIETNFITDNYYMNCGIIGIFLCLIILIINAPFIFIRKFKGN